jgi:hypothetical protein
MSGCSQCNGQGVITAGTATVLCPTCRGTKTLSGHGSPGTAGTGRKLFATLGACLIFSSR